MEKVGLARLEARDVSFKGRWDLDGFLWTLIPKVVETQPLNSM